MSDSSDDDSLPPLFTLAAKPSVSGPSPDEQDQSNPTQSLNEQVESEQPGSNQSSEDQPGSNQSSEDQPGSNQSSEDQSNITSDQKPQRRPLADPQKRKREDDSDEEPEFDHEAYRRAKKIMDEQPGSDVQETSTEVTMVVLECIVCLNKFQPEESERDEYTVDAALPSKCRACVDKEKQLEEQLTLQNNSVAAARDAYILNTCKVCGEYGHEDYECMVPRGAS